MTVGNLAEMAGVNTETIRYYENKGLLPKAGKNKSGYRIYDQNSLSQLKFIKTAQNIGFSLKEIQDLLKFSFIKGEDSRDLHARAAGKIELINGKIKELEKMKTALESFSSLCCGEHSLEDCHLVHLLWGKEEHCHE